MKARRVTAVLLLILVSLSWSIADLRRVLGTPLGDFGLATDGRVVSRLDADGPAARAGITLGDRVFGSSDTPLAHYALTRGIAATSGQVLNLKVIHGSQMRRVSLVARPEPLLIRALVALRFVLAFLTISVGTALLLSRPSASAWGFFLYCLTAITLPGAVLGFYVPWFWREAWFIPQVFIQGAAYVGAALFALTFAAQTLRSWRGMVLGVVAVAALFNVAISIVYLFVPAWGGRIDLTDNACIAFVLLAMLAGFVDSYARDKGAARQRLRWIIAALLISVPARYAAGALFPSYLSYGAYVALIAVQGTLPLVVAYAFFRKRVVDLNFVVSRTLVYAILTAVLIAVFSLLDATFSRAFAESRVGMGVDITVALLFGFSLNAAHRHIDSVIDRVLFRDRHRAQVQIENGASGLLHATKVEAITETVLQLPVRAMSLTGSALYLASDGGFARSGTTGALELLPAFLDRDDALALSLYARGKPVRLDDAPLSRLRESNTHDSPVIAVPLSAHGILSGFAVYGAHRNGADIDPDEELVIAPLALNAAIAFAYVEAQTLRARISELEARFA